MKFTEWILLQKQPIFFISAAILNIYCVLFVDEEDLIQFIKKWIFFLNDYYLLAPFFLFIVCFFVNSLIKLFWNTGHVKSLFFKDYSVVEYKKYIDFYFKKKIGSTTISFVVENYMNAKIETVEVIDLDKAFGITLSIGGAARFLDNCSDVKNFKLRVHKVFN